MRRGTRFKFCTGSGSDINADPEPWLSDKTITKYYLKQNENPITNCAHLHVLVVKVGPPSLLSQLIPVVWLEQPLCRQAFLVREPLPLGMSVGWTWLAHANTNHRPGGRQQCRPLVQAPGKRFPRRRKSAMDHDRMWKHVGFFLCHLFNIRAYFYCLKKTGFEMQFEHHTWFLWWFNTGV